MQHKTKTPIRPFNNDRTATFTAFRTASPQVKEPVGSAATVLPASAPPRPTQLTDEETAMLLGDMQGQDIAYAHNGLDPNRVARLLDLLN